MTIFLSSAWATPPHDIKLEYNVDKNDLHVVAQHPSDRLDRHYLRIIHIYKNDSLDDTVVLPRQKYAWGIDEHIDFKADPGDHLKVEIFCSQGGSGTAEYNIPAKDQDKKQPAAAAPG